MEGVSVEAIQQLGSSGGKEESGPTVENRRSVPRPSNRCGDP